MLNSKHVVRSIELVLIAHGVPQEKLENTIPLMNEMVEAIEHNRSRKASTVDAVHVFLNFDLDRHYGIDPTNTLADAEYLHDLIQLLVGQGEQV